MALNFTHSSYAEMLRRLKGEGYEFALFPEAEAALAAGRQFALLRHDIDFDLGKAAEMARIEQMEGVRATYFFLLRTEHYNLLSADGATLVREILEYGHHLGLHFDCAAFKLIIPCLIIFLLRL